MPEQRTEQESRAAAVSGAPSPPSEVEVETSSLVRVCVLTGVAVSVCGVVVVAWSRWSLEEGGNSLLARQIEPANSKKERTNAGREGEETRRNQT